MKISLKPSHEEKKQNALPGVFALFDAINTLISHERMHIAGYTAWVIFPALLSFGFSHLSLSSFWELIVTNIILVLDIIISTWVGACLTLIGIYRLRKESLDEDVLAARARKAMPMLLYLFAFSFFCVIAGLYLLIIPGVVALVWLAFTDILAVDEPDIRFSAAITQSKQLSHGHFFPVLWRILMGGVLFGLAYGALTLFIFSILSFFAEIHVAALLQASFLSETAPLPAWIPLLLTTLSLPFLPYITLYHVALYDALKKA
jgi:hypothetical protein